MTTRFLKFLGDDSGAVTVDWVVLCAGVVGMSLVLLSYLRDNLSSNLTRVMDMAVAQVSE